MVPPIFYTITRYAWALGIPWGMSMKHLSDMQVKHLCIPTTQDQATQLMDDILTPIPINIDI